MRDAGSPWYALLAARVHRGGRCTGSAVRRARAARGALTLGAGPAAGTGAPARWLVLACHVLLFAAAPIAAAQTAAAPRVTTPVLTATGSGRLPDPPTAAKRIVTASLSATGTGRLADGTRFVPRRVRAAELNATGTGRW
jgi:PPE-repeat protein